MAEFTTAIASEILAACQNGCEEAAGALSRALDGEFAIAPGVTSTIAHNDAPDTWNGPGLIITFHIGDSGALLLLPEASELLPDWCVQPDETGRSKLATLAQELGYSLLPESFIPERTSAARVKNLAVAFERAEPTGEVGYLPLGLRSGEKSGEAALVWPLQAVAKSLEASAEIPKSPAQSQGSEKSDPLPATPQPAAKPRLQYVDLDDGIRQLPNYAKSLLKVRVPVTVTLASTKYPVSQILELGPGSIIQFNKSCEDNLTLEAGDQPIASGEAVKVGDKFGLWITSMTLPDERFWVIHGRRSGARVK
ncbi:MAG: FliM/FliN family flagellar motor switch protein [Planctomycetaceae bacterium]|nr:FliM/FliN family flagellar motor switch protein [Planctomycetales bacterium]MCB9921550.1 FliM/FliN family flagellar motor switch protein [Planctomycetaceae bacterium]